MCRTSYLLACGLPRKLLNLYFSFFLSLFHCHTLTSLRVWTTFFRLEVRVRWKSFEPSLPPNITTRHQPSVVTLVVMKEEPNGERINCKLNYFEIKVQMVSKFCHFHSSYERMCVQARESLLTKLELMFKFSDNCNTRLVCSRKLLPYSSKFHHYPTALVLALVCPTFLSTFESWVATFSGSRTNNRSNRVCVFWGSVG